MPRWVFRFHKHKGLVLALLLAVDKLTHASIRIPVKMPSNSKIDKEVQASSTPSSGSSQRLAQPHPHGKQQW